VIGFAAETERIVEHAKEKRARKGCDWIVANDVSAATGVMGGDRNSVHLVTARGVECWPPQSKQEVARALVLRIAETLAGAPR
jgi:phosphopantothenoylcysteine decarboxylase/phosphopantothenate--cysteine ligase